MSRICRAVSDGGSKSPRVLGIHSASSLNRNFLVPRLQGPEDLSRYWSVAMTVEHLNIVGHNIRKMIQNLSDGEIPKRVARTEDVKPQGIANPAEVRLRFVEFLAESAAEEKNLPPIKRGDGGKSQHPWFGPLDSFQWHRLLGMHQRIHRRQIEEIL